MTEPCVEKDTIEALKSSLADIRVKLAETGGDVSHIKSRLDNGMSHTLSQVHLWLSELKPQIQHHASIVKRVEDIGWWISKGLIIALIGLLTWAVANGWKPI